MDEAHADLPVGGGGESRAVELGWAWGVKNVYGLPTWARGEVDHFESTGPPVGVRLSAPGKEAPAGKRDLHARE